MITIVGFLFYETESRMESGAGGGSNEDYCLMGTVSVCDDDKF